MASNTPTSAKCGICSEFYTDPRMLQCLHSFCVKCVKKLLEEQGSETSIKCPTCEKTASLPDGGVDALPEDLHKIRLASVSQYEVKLQGVEETACDRCIETSNGPAVSFCVNCCEFLCKVCSKDHKTWRKTLNHELQPVGASKLKSQSTNSASASLLSSIPEEPKKCLLHSDESLKFYCETCSVLICRDCIVLEHSGHSYNRIDKVAEREKSDLIVSLESADGAKSKLDDAIAKGGKVMQQIQAKQKSVEEDIENAFKALIETLRKRKEILLAKAAEISLGKQTALTIQGEEFKTLRDEIAETCELITQATQVYTPAEMLSVKAVMADKLQHLVKQFQEVKLEPCRSEVMPNRLDATELVEKIESFGCVAGGSFPGEAKIDLHKPRLIAEKEKRITISTFDEKGKPFRYGGEKVEVTLSLLGSKEPPIKGNVVDSNEGTYVATFTPSACGEHELSITIENQAVKESPFVLNVRKERSYSSISSAQRVLQTSTYPFSVAVDDNGHVYVAAYNGHCIDVFNQHAGTKLCTFGSNGSGDGQFSLPSDIAVRGNMLYIVDQSNHRVQKLTTSGQFISKFGAYGSGNGQLHTPHGICFDQNGRIFVSEYNSNRVSVFESDGSFAYHITDNLNNPWGLTFDPSGNLHVCNNSSNYVSIFTPEGKYISQYSSQVTNPAGIAIDEEGYTFIAEYYNSNTSYHYSRFSVLGPDHQLIRHVQNFNYATGITIDKEGFIYVCSGSSNQEYKY